MREDLEEVRNVKTSEADGRVHSLHIEEHCVESFREYGAFSERNTRQIIVKQSLVRRKTQRLIWFVDIDCLYNKSTMYMFLDYTYHSI